LPWKVEFPWNSPAQVHEISHGEAAIFGLKLHGTERSPPVVAEVEPGSPADRAGLAKGITLYRINGTPVSNNEEAAWAMLSLDRLHFDIERDDRSVFPWISDEPPEVPASGPIRIFGLEIDGPEDSRPVITAVRAASAEAVAGIRPGELIENLNGISVYTIGQLRTKLAAHCREPWLRIETSADKPAVTLTGLLPLPRSLPVHPTQLYSTIDAFLLCLLLLAYTPFRRRDGELTALLLTVHPIARFLIESIRTDEPPIWGTGLHISQNISLAILACAIGLWVYVLRQPLRASR
jgi:Prolipoprotein diacylglyceryl transferase/PDZ domain